MYTLGGGIAIEYGPDEASGVRTIRRGRRPVADLGGTLPEHTRAASEPSLGLQVVLLAVEQQLTISALHNGTETIPTSVATSSATALGPPLDVWLGLDMNVVFDSSGAYLLHLRLAGCG